MATIRQKRVAKLIIENTKLDIPKTGGEIVASSGYGVSMKKNPQVIINSDGVREALEEQGFSEDNAKRVVKQILNSETAEPNARLKAADMVFKVHGSYAPDKNINVNVDTNTVDPSDPKILEALKIINDQRANEN